MKFAFVTCVQIGLTCMEAIYEINGNLDLIISIPDHKAKKKSGRIYIDDFASNHGIPILKSDHINDQVVINTIKDHNIDWLFIIGWSQIASKEVIEAPNKGAIGAHPTLLPEGRGRAAIPWAIIKGLNKTGVSFFKMDEAVDAGILLGQEVVTISQGETSTTLYQKINKAHELLIKKLYVNLLNNNVKGVVQDESKATYWVGRKPKDGQIFHTMTMLEVDRLVRATTKPYPGAFLQKNDTKIIVWEGFSSQHKKMESDLLEIELSNGFYYGVNFEIVKL